MTTENSTIRSIEIIKVDDELVIVRKLNGVAIAADTPRQLDRKSSLQASLKEHLKADWDYMNGHSDD